MHELILLAVLIAISAFFSAAETALISMSKIKISRLIEQKAPGAKFLKQLRDNPGDLLSTVLIGNNLVNIAAAALATSLAIRYFADRHMAGVGAAIGVATGVMTFLILVFGEIIPKTVAIYRAEKISLFLAPIIWIIQLIVKPIAYLVGFICKPFIYLLGGKAPEKGPFITEDEIRLILTAGEQEGVIAEEEREMISSIFEFGDTVVRAVMTPRPDISAVPVTVPAPDLIKEILESGHSRIPVYEGTLDNIIGVIYAKDLLKAQQTEDLRALLRPVVFIPEAKRISDLLHEMQSARTHLAVIVDEYGVCAGLVTLEDLIEEIVGEIHDEFEREEKMIEQLDQNTYLIDGRLTIKDLNDRLKLGLPQEGVDYDTVGGFVLTGLGKAPSVGQTVRWGEYVFSVERVLRRRITRVKLENKASAVEEGVGG